MADLPHPRRKTHGMVDAGYNATPRTLNFEVNLATDVTMGTSTDVIQLGILPEGSVIQAAFIEQVVAGTGTGTLQVRSGTTALSSALTATDVAGTRTTATAANLPRVVPASGEELNLLGATAVRTTGIIRVVVVYVEGQRYPNRLRSAPRDATL